MMGVADRPLRIVVIGDELAAGAGDPKGLGWVGRVAARTVPPVAPTFLTLAVPGENSDTSSPFSAMRCASSR